VPRRSGGVPELQPFVVRVVVEVSRLGACRLVAGSALVRLDPVIRKIEKVLNILDDVVGDEIIPSVNGLLNRVGGLLDVDPSVITYDELAANMKVGIPSKAANDLPLSVAEFSANLNLLVPAGYKLDLIMLGTFTYITPTQYTDGLSEAQYGYDGLDTQGDPKDNGGTYAAVLD